MFVIPSAAVAVLWLALVAPAAAQMPDRVRNPNRYEIDAMYGFSAVDVDKWALAQTSESDMRAFGLNLRMLFLDIGNAQVGVELGTHHHFKYEILQVVGAVVTREKHTVASQHLGFDARFGRSPRMKFSSGVGFHYFSETTLPSAHFTADFLVHTFGRFVVPIGARIDYIPDDNVGLWSMLLKSGLTLQP